MNDTPRPRPTPDDSSIKETLQSIIIAFILAFVFRGFVVEAFVIPTGSMAPTLLGQHVSFTCPQCGYHFTSGPRDNSYPKNTGTAEPHSIQGRHTLYDKETGREIAKYPPLQVHCPMCDYPITVDSAPVNAGDRILVLKYVYAFAEPRRWDVVVFRNPEQPAINYIKRLIGLPDEYLRIIRGNIYTSKDQGATWHIQRKPVTVQQAVWQPLYHSQRVPLDNGDSVKRPATWANPWQPAESSDTALWQMQHHGRTFAFTPVSADSAGTLNFDFANHPTDAMDYYAYNELPLSNNHEPPTTTLVEDLRVAATVLPEKSGASVTLNIGGELFNYQGIIHPDGSVQINMQQPTREPGRPGPGAPAPGASTDSAASAASAPDTSIAASADSAAWITVARADGSPLTADHPHRIEMWCVDQSVQFWIDGQMVAHYDIPVADQPTADSPFALSVRTLLDHNDVKKPAGVSVRVSGSPMRLSDLDLDRDLYYTNMGRSTALATYNNVAKLADDEFFCLGDNSPQSKDGRLWLEVDRWVEYLTRNDHTHLSPDGNELPGVGVGIVPRRLMIGRAFFVYWPAADRLSPNSKLWVPNFGDMRFIH